MRKLTEWQNNIFTPKIVDIILPGCSIESNVKSNSTDAEDGEGEEIPSRIKKKSSKTMEEEKGDVSHRMSDLDAQLASN